MDDKKLWLKISGSINYYLQSYSKRMTNEELLKDYLEYALPDMDGDGVHTYLDKQTLERVVWEVIIMIPYRGEDDIRFIFGHLIKSLNYMSTYDY